MLFAAVYDIHGNLPALDAVLAEIRQLEVDEVIIGGDVVPGPMPRETLDRLAGIEVPVRYIRGNGETAVMDQLTGRDLQKVPSQYRPAIAWTADQLTPDQTKAMRAWPLTAELDVPGLGRVVFCHATPRDEDEIFTAETDAAQLRPIFQAVGAAVVVCGHTHMQFDRTIGSVRVVNAGSTGMPFGRTGADWLLLGDAIEFRHTDYDLEAAANLLSSNGYPGAQQFATEHVLRSPSAASMLERFARLSSA